MSVWRITILVAAVLTGACASPVPGERLDETTDHPSAPPIAPFDECTVVTYREPAISRDHLEVCSPVEYPSHPPAGGDHYAVWAAYGTYDAPVPWGFLVHSMEHGGVVLAHHCDGGCPEVLDAYAQLIDARDDPGCRDLTPMNRFVVAPDPGLEWPIAVVAWEHVYLATCLDVPSLTAFVDAHYDHGPEALCAPGFDGSADAWCP